MQLTNHAGFTCHLIEGEELGTAVEATLVNPQERTHRSVENTPPHSLIDSDGDDLLVKEVNTVPVAS